MLTNIKIRNQVFRGITHIVFWIVIYFFYTYFLGYGSQETHYVNLFAGFLMPITIVLSYFLIYYLIPKYLLFKKYKAFILYSIYAVIISVYLIVLSVLYGLFFLSDVKSENTITITKTLPFVIFGVFFVALIVVAIRLIKHNYQSIIRNETLEKKFLQTKLELKENELKFLKMQLHPHFLFNTLNTLYGFALKKSEEAPDMILKLSNLLDYILYQVDKPLVLLEDEVKHIDDYISLEKMRFQDSLQVNFQKEIHQKNLQIAPMLLLPFVENAFKHGTQIDEALQVDINLKTDTESLCFQIENSFTETLKSKKGIGLDNIQKRLEMLFKDNFSLEILPKEKLFAVQLKIPLKNV